MRDVVIEYNNNEYPLKPLTIDTWVQLNSLLSFAEGYEDYIKLITFMSGIPEEDILKASKWEIDKAIGFINEYMKSTEHKFQNTFEFEGQKYRFIDLENLSFGEFIDIDTFLQKSEIERKQNLNMLMALLYREVDNNNMLAEYDATKLEARAKLFKSLDIKYVNGALVFFSILGTILRENIQLSFRQRMRWMIRRTTKKALSSFGVGMLVLSFWLGTIYSRLKMWLNKIFLLPLTF